MKKFEPKPFDIEEMKRNPWKPDPHHIAKVLSELLSRQYGFEVEIVLTPKEQDDKSGEEFSQGDNHVERK